MKQTARLAMVPFVFLQREVPTLKEASIVLNRTKGHDISMSHAFESDDNFQTGSLVSCALNKSQSSAGRQLSI